jgi:pimeloyl-ACP methyl ester carboxylesterase
MERRRYDVDGAAFHVRVSVEPVPENRPPIVLVHGLLVSSRYMMPTAKRLAPDFRVYAPDLPGYGKSDKPRRALNVPELADALAAWMRSAGLKRAALVANSFGCQVAAHFAVRYPERVERLILLGPTVDPHARGLLSIAARWLLMVPLEPFSLDLVVARDFLDMGPRCFLASVRHMLHDHIELQLRHIQAPTLIVRGERDTTVSQRWAEEAVRLLPHGRLAVIPGVPHTINYNSPDEVARLIRSFLGVFPSDAS